MQPVIVRVFKSGDKDVKKYGLLRVHLHDMILVFPTQPASKMEFCNSYMVVGQHGDCNYPIAIIPNTRPATESEAKRMLDHYQQTYNSDTTFKVYKKWQHRFDVERRKALEEMK